ncbi:hypothetical protein ON010_g8964 [Phytophthora cinnamomi]|nr:hypothetical protein ON010_g8964 [Phytophthora cinnamomi]
MTHYNGTLLENNTYSGGEISHVGQLFFDQDLLTAVQSTDTYAVNTWEITENTDDSILAQAAAEGFDPFVEYALLGDSVEDGLLAWISVGVDMASEYSVEAAAAYTADGGVLATSTTAGAGEGVLAGSPSWPLDRLSVLLLSSAIFKRECQVFMWHIVWGSCVSISIESSRLTRMHF